MSWFNLVNKNGDKADIMVYGVIGTGWYSNVGAEQIARELKEIGNVSEINVRIHSTGGSVFDGVAIYNTLKNHPAKVNVIIEGICASIATVIAMAGDTITMGPGTKFMIHNPLTISYGEKKDLEKDAKILDGIKEDIIDAYMTKVKSKGTTREKIAEMMDKESYLSANEALEFGFITNMSEGSLIPDIINFGMMFREEKSENQDGKNNALQEDGLLKKMMNYFADNFKEDSSKIENKVEETKNMSMTKDEIRNKYLDIYNEIKNEGTLEERTRIQSLENLIGKGNDSLVNEAKYKTFKPANDVALEILNTEPEKEVIDESEEDEFVNKFNNKREDGKILNDIKRGSEKLNSSEEETQRYANLLAEKLKNRK